MNNRKIIMPSSLTAENGAKAALSGEFFEELEEVCLDCHFDLEDEEYQCDICQGRRVVKLKIPIRWQTIKRIYAKAVKELGT